MTFRCKQLALAVEAAGITAEGAVAPDHTMARNENGDMVVTVRGPHRAHGPRLADGGCDLGVASRLAGRNLPQLAPNRFLEGGAGNVDRQFARSKRLLDRGQCALDQISKSSRIFDDRRLREAVAQRFRIIVECQSADSLARRRDQHLAERAVEMGPADRLAKSPVPPGRRCHAEPLLRIAVETARTCIAGLVDRVGHATVLLERAFRTAVAQSTGVFRWGHAKITLEDALKVVWRISDC